MTQMMKLSYEQELNGNFQLGWTQLEKIDQKLGFFSSLEVKKNRVL